MQDRGTNLVIEYRYAETGPQQLSALAADLVVRNVSVIVSGSSDATGALQRATTSPIGPTTELAWQQTEAAARRLGLTLQSLEVQGVAPDLDKLFAAAVSQKAEAVIALPDALLARHFTQIAALAANHRLPSMFFERTAVEAGGLASYGPSILDLFVRAASYADKVLKGAKPGDLPVEKPREFDLVLNLKTARALGITVPDTLQIMANDVIQ